MRELARRGELPQGVSIDALGNSLNLGRQARPPGMSGRQWVKLKKLLRLTAKELHIRDDRFKSSTDSNKAAW
jgi:hypothetical protein